MHADQIERIQQNLSFWGWQSWQFHNDTVKDTYGFQWQEEPNRAIRYVLGYGPPENVDRYLAGGQVRIVHWIGTDALTAHTTGRVPPQGTIHFCDSWDVKLELADLGIDARVVAHRPRNRVEEPLPMPPERCMAIYMPPTRHDFFRYDLCVEVARTWGGKVKWHDVSEHELLAGTRDFHALMASCSHYLRLPIHDGFSHTAAEFVMAGRTVVTTAERPYQHRAKPNTTDVLIKLREEPFDVAPAYYRWLTEKDRLYEAIWDATGW